ncbi:zinc ABC transporter substrate-binding protein [Paracoccus yeei]|uniref:zinc ABC transporter substrate-binding protein n=1 Tax=Paracoccus yeei TaxID=147645 RepID=UPI003BF8DCEF
MSHLRLLPPALAALALSALPALAAPPRIVTDTAVTGALVAQVMGDLGAPEVLTEAGADPHHYQLRPSQARKLQDADLLVWVGPELTPWLQSPAEGLARGTALALLALPETQRQSYAAEGGHDAHAHDDHGHEEHDHDHDHEGHGHDHEGHDHTGTDPHAWLDPENGRAWLTAIAEALARHDPENAQTYRANAAAGAQALAALEQELQAQLQPAQGKTFVVFHDAYGYFTGHFGLNPAIAVSLGDAAAPSAARLSEVQDRIRDSHASCAFPEANHDPKLLQVAVEGTGARLGAALDPEGTRLPPGAGLYAQVLRGIGTALADCLTAP